MRFRARFMNMEVAKSFGSWLKYVGGRRNARKVTRRIFGRVVMEVVAEAFQTWFKCCGDEEVEMRRERGLRVVVKLYNRQIGKGWESWKIWTRERRREEGVLMRFARRIVRRDVARGFGGWVDFVERRKR